MRRFVLMCSVVLFTCLSAPTVSAQAEADEPEASVASPGSDSVASQERTIPGGTLAITSYIILWVMTMGVVGVTIRRQVLLSRQLADLEGRMDEVLGTFDERA